MLSQPNTTNVVQTEQRSDRIVPTPSASPSSISGLRRRCIVAVVLGLVCGAAYYLGTTLPSDGPQPADAFPLVPSSLDFGEAVEDSQFKWTIQIANQSSKDIKIERFLSSCSCTSLEPETVRVPANGKAQVQVTLDLRYGRSEGEKPTQRDFEVALAPILTGSNRLPPDWRIYGKVRRLLTVPRVIRLPGPFVSGERFELQTAAMFVEKLVGKVAAYCDPSFAAVAVHETEKHADDRGARLFEAKFLLSDSLAIGKHKFPVKLQPLGLNGQIYPPVNVSVEVQVAGFVRPVPEELLLGVRRVGEIVEQTVIFERLSSSAEFEISGYEWLSAAIHSPVEEKDKGASRFRIRVSISELGPQSEQLFFIARRTDRSGTAKILIWIHYHGVKEACLKPVKGTIFRPAQVRRPLRNCAFGRDRNNYSFNTSVTGATEGLRRLGCPPAEHVRRLI